MAEQIGPVSPGLDRSWPLSSASAFCASAFATSPAAALGGHIYCFLALLAGDWVAVVHRRKVPKVYIWTSVSLARPLHPRRLSDVSLPFCSDQRLRKEGGSRPPPMQTKRAIHPRSSNRVQRPKGSPHGCPDGAKLPFEEVRGGNIQFVAAAESGKYSNLKKDEESVSRLMPQLMPRVQL